MAKQERKATPLDHNLLQMGSMLLLCLVLALTSIDAATGNGQADCLESKCNKHGPPIRFPFKLKHQPNHCGYPGFDISCNSNGETVLQLPVSVKLVVKKLDYKSQVIHVRDKCLPRSIRNLNISSSPFSYESPQVYNYTFFNCTANTVDYYYMVRCLEMNGYEIRVESANNDLFESTNSVVGCTKFYDLFSVPYDIPYGATSLKLYWKNPDCRNCERSRKKCRLNSNSTNIQIECYGKLTSNKDVQKILIIAGAIVGSIVIMLLLFVFYRVYNEKRLKVENQARVEQFLEDYKAFKPTRYTYNDIKRITEDFKDKLGQGGYGTVYKGKLSSEVIVAIKILNNSIGDGVEFINEVGTMGRIHHVNVVRLVGYCADGRRKALVYDYLPNDSLEKIIFSNHELGWEKLHAISLGIAKGIEYLHQGCEQKIVHFDIKPHNILLDHNLSPKICDFGLAKLCSKDQSVVSMTAARGTMGYIAPEVFSRNFGNVSSKSDVYSFGMLVLEMVGGRKNIDETVEKTSQKSFPEWIYSKLTAGEEFAVRVYEESDATISRKMTIVGLWCIQWNPADRPSMRAVVQMLEGQEEEGLSLPPNPFAAKNGGKLNGVMLMPGVPLYEQQLTVIEEDEENIL